MGQKKKSRIVATAGAIISSLWWAYSNWTTVSQLPTDASQLARLLADPPVYLPWLAVAGFVLLAARVWWPERNEAERNEAATLAPIPQAPGEDPAVPDMELKEVLDRLYDSLGGPPQLQSDFEARVDRVLKDNVRHRRLHTWGRKDDPNGTLDDVWAEAWLRGNFSHKRGSLKYRHPDNPRHQHVWTDLHFSRPEVDRWLPPKPLFEMHVFG